MKEQINPLDLLLASIEAYNTKQEYKIIPWQVENKKDTIGYLITAFNKMLVQQQQYTKELVQQRAILERSVTVSTRELKEAFKTAKLGSEAKSNFLATMSHEIRTPMNGVIGMTRLLIDSGLNKEQLEQANIILDSAEALLVILNDILDISKLEAGKLVLESIDVNITDTVKGVVKLFEQKAKSECNDLSFIIDKDIPQKISTDLGRLRQILLNLVGNALKFTKNGKVVVTVTRVGEIADHVIIKFVVSDTGMGIPKDIIPCLFEKFTQADSSISRKFGGTGLGLAICKRLVHLMQGEIGIESELGKGSDFWFTILAKESTLGMNGLSSQSQNISSRGLRVLLAEDNRVNQMVAQGLFKKLGFIVDTVQNGREAVEAVKKRTDYAVIFMDIQMPEMDGIEATKAIRQLAKPICDIPIIALTANAMAGDKEKYLDNGMDDFVSKPINQCDLQEAVQRVIEGQVNF